MSDYVRLCPSKSKLKMRSVFSSTALAGDEAVAALNHPLELFRPNWDYHDTGDPQELNCDDEAWKGAGESKAACQWCATVG